MMLTVDQKIQQCIHDFQTIFKDMGDSMKISFVSSEIQTLTSSIQKIVATALLDKKCNQAFIKDCTGLSDNALFEFMLTDYCKHKVAQLKQSYIAQKLFFYGLPLDKVQKNTGLSFDEIFHAKEENEGDEIPF